MPKTEKNMYNKYLQRIFALRTVQFKWVFFVNVY